MALAGRDAQIYVSGTSASMTEEAMGPIGDGTPVLQWQVADADRDLLDPSVTFTVEVSDDGGTSWSTVSPGDYTLRYLLGVVEFDSDPFGGSTSGNDVRISGSYLPLYSLLEGQAQDVSFERDLYETTSFQDEGTRRGATGPLDMTGSYTLHRILERELDADGGSEPTLREILLGQETHGSTGSIDQRVVYRVEPNTSQGAITGAWVKFTDESLDASMGSKQERTISMEADAPDAAMATQTARVGDIL